MQSLCGVGLLVVLLFASIGNAQDQPDDDGNIYAIDELSADTSQVLYPIELAADDMLIVQAIPLTDGLQPRLTLFDQQASEIAIAVDQLVVTNVPADSYMLRVDEPQTRFGRFALTTSIVSTRGEPTSLSVGEIQQASFTADETSPIVFRVTSDTDQPLTVNLTSDNFTGIIRITDARNGSVHASVDHTRFDAASVTLTPDNGDYYVIMQGRGEDTADSRVQISLSESSTDAPEITCVANGVEGGSNIYAEPNTSATVIGTLNPGDDLTVLGRLPGTWYIIAFDGQRGWISTLEATVGGSDCTDGIPRLDPLN